MEKNEVLNRWRLILGRYADSVLPFHGEAARYLEMDGLMDFLYGREYGEERGMRQADLSESLLTVPEWIRKVRSLFPKSTVEVLEKHALQKYQLTELLTDKDILQKLEPNMDLLKSILQMKHLMKGEVLETAKHIVRKVADELARKLESDIRRSFSGRRIRNRTGYVKSFRNLDFKKTIAKNLKHYHLEDQKLYIEHVYFNQRVKAYSPWNVHIVVDESGSMLGSVIHSAVMAGIFARLPMLKTRLVIFDTEVMDLTGYVDDPVEAMFNIQLGGGTNIAKALQYCESQIGSPSRTIVVLVSDLCEGGPQGLMYHWAKSIVEGGSRLIILTALDYNAKPVHDKNAAERMAALGAHVAAMTPEGLSEWIAKVIQ